LFHQAFKCCYNFLFRLLLKLIATMKGNSPDAG
jgi:hypothetical protein